jgi:outer membrane lipoprotein-sorting protein
VRCWVVIACLFAALPAWADEAADKGRAIAAEADRRDTGFKDSEAAVVMILKSARGDESRRALRIKVLEAMAAGEGDKSLVIFDEPRDIAGAALLSFSHVLEPDDQWLYLPEVGRVKRISGANRAGPFMGSEFAYEDIAAPALEKYSYRFLRQEPCGKLTCNVIERTPLYKDSGYARQVVWLDAAEYRPWRVDFYDRRGAHLKRLTYGKFARYGAYWRAHRLLMENLRTGKSTLLAVTAYRLGVGLSEADFSQASLKRAQ